MLNERNVDGSILMGRHVAFVGKLGGLNNAKRLSWYASQAER